MIILKAPRFIRNTWYYPAWTMTEPWKFGTSKGGDEFNRRTSCLHLGPFGVFVYAHEDDEWYDWMHELVQGQLAKEDADEEAAEA